MSGFTRAVRSRRKVRAALDGPPGGGKSFSALRLAFSMVKVGMGSRVAVIDTENESASLYAGEAPDGIPWEFDTLPLKTFSPDAYTAGINLAFKSGFDILIIDSLSHAWNAEGGALDLVDKKGGNKYTAWKDVTPLHRRMVDTIINAPGHVIVTMRSKVEYVLEDDERGKKVPRRVGVAPVQRDGMEYEFDVYGSFGDQTHQMRVTKSRCSAIDGLTGIKPGPDFWQPLFDWLNSATASGTVAYAEPPAPVTKTQLEELAGLQGDYYRAKGAADDAARAVAWSEVMVRFGVGSARQLSRGQADELIGKLRAMLASQPAAEQKPLAGPPPAVADPILTELARLRGMLFTARGVTNGTDEQKTAVWQATLKELCADGITSVSQLDDAGQRLLTESLGKLVDPFTYGPSTETSSETAPTN